MSWDTLEDALTLGTGTERSFRCHVHGDTNPSASVNALNGLWICYTCGARGKVDLETMEISIESVVREVSRVARIMEGEAHPTYPESWLSIFDAGGPGEYWLSRFTDDACRHFRLGMDPGGDAATYPYRDHTGRVLGVVRRSLTGERPKYKYPYGAGSSSNLFNYHECTDDQVVLVEGAADAIAAWECGVQAMALYGARLSRVQYRLLRRYAPKKILVATDQDREGHRVAKEISEAFPDLPVIRLRWDAKDLCDLTINERTDVLAQRKHVRVVSRSCGSPEPPRPPLSLRLSRNSATPVPRMRRPRIA